MRIVRMSRIALRSTEEEHEPLIRASQVRIQQLTLGMCLKGNKHRNEMSFLVGHNNGTKEIDLKR